VTTHAPDWICDRCGHPLKRHPLQSDFMRGCVVRGCPCDAWFPEAKK
jgi:hypothetical protein